MSAMFAQLGDRTSKDQLAARRDVSVQVESALQAVRLILAAVGLLSVVATRGPLVDDGAGRIIVLAMVIVATVGVLCYLGFLASRSVTARVASQLADVVATTTMVVLMDQALGGLAWALLVIPIVAATIRFGSVATFLTWIGGSALFALSSRLDLIDAIDGPSLVRIPGVLLAVAVAVSVLASAMREGWVVQHNANRALLIREKRLSTIENAARSLHDLDPDESLHMCATKALELGFDAASVTLQGNTAVVLGDTPLVAGTPKPERARSLASVWNEGGKRTYSVAVHEPQTDHVVVGWSKATPTRDLVDSLETLVAHTSTAIETSTLLRRLKVASRHDALTSLLNRRGLDETIQELGTQQQIAVAFLDLDDLKTINDQYGHQAGDKAITALANRLKVAAGSENIVARIGGDEFVIVVPGGDIDTATKLGMKVLDSLLQPVTFGNVTHHIGVSIGLAADETPVDLNVLLAQADAAVYEAKRHGKRQVVAAAGPDTFTHVEQAPTNGPGVLQQQAQLQDPPAPDQQESQHHPVPGPRGFSRVRPKLRAQGQR